MSGADPIHPPVPLVAVRRSGWQRARRALLWTLLVLVALVGSALAWVHTASGQEMLRARIEAALAAKLDGSATLGRLDATLLGDVTLHDLVLRDPEGVEVVRLETLELGLDWESLSRPPLRLRSLRLDGLAVNVKQGEDGALNLDRVLRPWLTTPREARSVVLERVVVERVSFDAALPALKLALRDVHLAGRVVVEAEAGRRRITLEEVGATLRLERPGLTVEVPRASARVSLDATSVRRVIAIEQLRGVAEVSRAAGPEGEGGGAPLPPRRHTVPVDLTRLDATISDERVELALSAFELGAVRVASLEVQLPLAAIHAQEPPGLVLEGLHVDASRLNALLGRELLVGDLDVSARASGPAGALQVSGLVVTPGGRLTLSGRLDLSDVGAPGYDLRLVGADIRTDRLIRQPPAVAAAGESEPERPADGKTAAPGPAAQAPARPAVHTSLTLSVRGRGVTPATLVASGELELGATQVGALTVQGPCASGQACPSSPLRVVASVERGRWTVEHVKAAAFERVVTGSVTFDPATQALEAHVLSRGDLAPTLQALREVGLLGAAQAVGSEPGGGAAHSPIPSQALSPSGPAVTVGELDIDLLLSARGLGRRTRELLPSILPADLAQRVPMDRGAMKIALSATDVATPRLSAEAVEVQGELSFDRGVPEGALSVTAAGLEVRARRFEVVQLDLSLDAGSLRLAVSGRDDRGLALKLEASGALVAGERVVLTVTRLEATRTGLTSRLTAPMTIVWSIVPGSQTVAVALEGLELSVLAAFAGRELDEVSGRVSGKIDVTGLPAAPGLGFDLAAEVTPGGGAQPLTVSLVGKAAATGADVHLDVSRGRPLLSLDASVPLATVGGAVAVDREGPWSLKAQVRDVALQALRDLLPARLARPFTISGSVDVVGSLTRPTANLDLEVVGPLVPALGRQRAAVNARWTPNGPLGSRLHAEARVSRLTGARLVDAVLDLELPPAPTRAAPVTRWALDARVPPFALADLPATAKLSGATAALEAKLSGTLRDVTGQVTVGLRGVPVKAEPAAALDLDLVLAPHRDRTDVAILGRLDGLAGEPADPDAPVDTLHTLDTVDLAVCQRAALAPALPASTVICGSGTVGVGAASLSRMPQAVREAPLALRLEVPRRLVSAYAGFAPALAALPGALGLTVDVGGTVSAPTASLAGDWTGWDSVAGGAGRLALSAQWSRGPSPISLDLALGPVEGPARVSVRASADSAAVAQRFAAGGSVRLIVDAVPTPLRELLPAFVLRGAALPVDGTLQGHLEGHVVLAVVDGRVGADHLALDGALEVSGIAATLPGTTRRVRDGRIRVRLGERSVHLDPVELFETDTEHPARRLHVTGALALAPGLRRVEGARLSLSATEWLLIGPLDAPQATLTAELGVELSREAPVGRIQVTAQRLELRSPDRFLMRHAGETSSLGDVSFVGEDGASAVGVLRRRSAPASKLPPLGDWDVSLRFPNGLHAWRSPLNLWLDGQLDVSLREGKPAFRGGFTAREGHLEYLGHHFPLVEGRFVFSDQCAGCMDLLFAQRAHHTTQRDFSTASAGGAAETIRITGLPPKLVVSHGGAGNAYLPDVMSTRNAHRPRTRGSPELPGSATVQFPGPWFPSLVPTVLAINLPHLLFLDHADFWADPSALSGAYGRLTTGELDRTSGDPSALRRFSLRFREPAVGRSDVDAASHWVRRAEDERSVFGVGLSVGTRLGGGPHVFWELATPD